MKAFIILLAVVTVTALKTQKDFDHSIKAFGRSEEDISDSSISEFKWSDEWSDFDSGEPSSFAEDDSLFENNEDGITGLNVRADSLYQFEHTEMSKAKTLFEGQAIEITDDSIISSQQQINSSESSGRRHAGEYLSPESSGSRHAGEYLSPESSGSRHAGEYLSPESSGSRHAGEYLSPRDTKKKSDVDKKDGLYKEVSLSESHTRRVVNKQSQSNSNTFEEIQVDTLNQEQKPNAFVLNKTLDKTKIVKEKMKGDVKLKINRNIGNANDWKVKWTSGIKHRAWVPIGLLDKPTAVYKVNDTQKNLQTASRSNKLSFDNGAQGSRQTVFSRFQARRNFTRNDNANNIKTDSQKQTMNTTIKRTENKTNSTRKNQVAERNSISSVSADIGQGGNIRGRAFDRRNTGSIQRVSNLGTRLPGSTNSIIRTRFSPKQSRFTSRNAHHRLPQTSMRSRNAVKFPGQFMNTNKVRNGADANIGRQQRRINNGRGSSLSSWNLQELLNFIIRFASKNTTNNPSNQMRSVVSELNRRSSNNRRSNSMKRSNLRSLLSRNYRQQSIGLKRLTPGTVFTGGPLYQKIILRQRTPPYRLIERYVPVLRTCKY